MKLIGLGHKKQHGKSTVARFLSDLYDFREYAFADPLKEVVDTLFPFPSYCKKGNKELIDPELGFSYRDACEMIGEMFRQKYGKDFWVKTLQRRIKKDLQLHPSKTEALIVVSDVRHPEEAEWVKSQRGTLIKVHNPRKVQQVSEEEYKKKHISEIALDNYAGWDFIIQNDGTLSQLEQKINKLIPEILKQKLE